MNTKYFKGILRFPRKQRVVKRNTHAVNEVAVTTDRDDKSYEKYIDGYNQYLSGETSYFPDPRD